MYAPGAAVLLTLIAGAIAPVAAQSLSCAADERSVSFAGDVQHGDTFEQSFGRALVFRLAPSPDPGVPGWTIEIRRRGDADRERELSWLVTPPYRGWTPRYLDTSYGKSAAESVAITPREFAFLADPSDFDRAIDVVRRLLWPGNATDAQLDAARRTLDAVPTGRGQLHIRDATFGRAPDGAQHIARLAFAVTLCAR